MKKPAIITGLKWGIFSGTATLSAFVLPAFILGNIFTDTQKPFGEIITIAYVSIILFAALYHGLYRVKTIGDDLDFGKKTMKIVSGITSLLLAFGTTGILIYIILWSI